MPPAVLALSSEELEGRGRTLFAPLEAVAIKPSASVHERLQAKLRLGEMVGSLFSWALIDGEWQWAKRCLAEYHLRLGDEDAPERAEVAMACDDEHMRAAASVLRMLPHWRRVGSIAGLPALRFGTIEKDNDFLGKAHLLGPYRDQVVRYVRERERRRLRWESSTRKAITAEIYTTLSAARRAARVILMDHPGPDPVAVRVEVEPEVLLQFCRDHAADDACSGLISGVSSPGRDGKRWLYAVAHLETSIEGRPVRLQMTSKLMDTTSDRIDYYRRMVGKFAEQHGAEDLVGDVAVRGAARLDNRAAGEFDPGAKRLPSRSPSAVFGSDYCTHRNSTWKKNRLETWLSCDDCLNGAIVRIPLHQLPGNASPPEDVDEEAYIDERQFLGEIYDRPEDAPIGGWRALRARDGLIAADTRLYATGERPRPAAARSISSVASAMNRR